jgi:protein-S-isoprenylcysteine O-methyltransferase Ste14
MVDLNKISWKSLLFVLVQIICLGLIAVTGSLFSANVILFLIEMIGIGLGVWSVIIMRPGNFNITPDPLSWSKLVRIGPYRIIRHPMYLALLLTTLPLIIDKFSMLRLLLWIILLIDLVLKINFEEKLLAAEVDGYENYMKDTYRLIPLIH